jgi:hypothetical protein
VGDLRAAVGRGKVEVGTTGFNASSFGRDEWGEVYSRTWEAAA